MLGEWLTDGTITLLKTSTNTLKLLNPNANALMLGDATHEGGDIKVYRDGSGNLQLAVDADAASNAKALDIYGGVVCQNYLTIGQTTLNTTYPFYVNGTALIVGAAWISGVKVTNDLSVYTGNGLISRADNYASLIAGNITVGGTDATDHAVCLQINGDDIICAQATGDGAGGIVDPKAIIKEQLVYTPSSDTAITAASGITVTKAIMRVAGNGGAIDITADPQIVAGTDGQIVIIQGTHDTNTVTLDDGTGLALSAQCVLAAQDNITLMYDSGDSEWIETSRTTVT